MKVLLILLLLLLIPSLVLAQGIDQKVLIEQLQEQVQTLLDQIQILQHRVSTLSNELGGSQGQTGESPGEASLATTTPTVSPPELTRSLSRGASGDDVRKLQEFLANDKEIYPEGLITGFFGPLTEAAAKRWQEKYGVESVGIIGPQTIAKFKEFEEQKVFPVQAPTPSGTVPAQPIGLTGTTTVPATRVNTIPVATTTTNTATNTPSLATTSIQSLCAKNPSSCMSQNECTASKFFWYAVSCHPIPPSPISCAASYNYCVGSTECSANGWYWCRNSCYGYVDACLGQTYTPPAQPAAPAPTPTPTPTTTPVPTPTPSTPPTTTSTTTTSIVTTPTGVCLVRDSYTSATTFFSSDAGKGYAKLSKPGVNTISGLQSACTRANYDTLKQSYCGQNNNSFQEQVLTYDSQGNYQSLSCGAFGCDSKYCTTTSTATSSIPTPISPTSACVGGDGRVPGLPICLMPENLAGTSWNEVDNATGRVLNGAVCSAAVCGRNGEWRRMGYPPNSTYIQTPYNSANWGRYFTNGVWEMANGTIVQPGTTDTTPPAISSVQITNITNTSATITWTTNEPADSQIDYGATVNNYTQYTNSSPLEATLSLNHVVSLSGLSSNTHYEIKAKSKDASGNLAVTANYYYGFTTQTTTSPDTVPPSTPTSLAATTADPYQVNLSWSASTDNVGVTGYKIYRNGSPLTSNYISNSSFLSLSYADTMIPSSNYNYAGATFNTTFSYTVAAYDAAGNLSPQSSAVVVTTPLNPLTVDIKANGSDDPITVVNNTSMTIGWNSSTYAASCAVSNTASNTVWTTTSGYQYVSNVTTSSTYTAICVSGVGLSVSDSVTVNVSPPSTTSSTTTMIYSEQNSAAVISVQRQLVTALESLDQLLAVLLGLVMNASNQ